MKKIKPFNREYFAKSINELLINKYNNYNSLIKETIMLSKDWDWKKDIVSLKSTYHSKCKLCN